MGLPRRGRLAYLAVPVACIAALVGGCGSSSNSSSSGSSKSTGSASGGKKLTVAYDSYSLAAKNQADLWAGFQAEAKKYGYTAKVVDSGGDVAKANQLMQTLVSEGVNAIAFDSYGDKFLQAGIQAAKAASIPVYGAYNWGHPTEIAASILLGAPWQETNQMIKDLGNKGQVLAFTLPAGANCVNGVQIFKSIMAQHPGIHVTYHATVAPGWQVDSAAATKAWLASRPAGSGPYAIWGCWDGPSVGAISALNALGRHDVKVYGDYGEADAIVAVEKKEMTATWYFDANALGRQIVDLMHQDASVPFSSIKPHYLTFPPILVDQANVAQFMKQHPGATSGA